MDIFPGHVCIVYCTSKHVVRRFSVHTTKHSLFFSLYIIQMGLGQVVSKTSVQVGQSYAVMFYDELEQHLFVCMKVQGKQKKGCGSTLVKISNDVCCKLSSAQQ